MIEVECPRHVCSFTQEVLSIFFTKSAYDTSNNDFTDLCHSHNAATYCGSIGLVSPRSLVVEEKHTAIRPGWNCVRSS